jgi:hypothetical protein
MNNRAHVRTLLANETRALLPMWLACVVAATVAGASGRDSRLLSLIAIGTATIALGAQSIGHEYSHRTIGLMLMLPVSRRRLLAVKLGVLGAMLLLLVAYAWLLGLFGLFVDVPALPWLFAAAALCLAPSLTMLCRSALAGAIFSLSLPPTLLMVMTFVIHKASGPPDPVVLDLWSRLHVALLAGAAMFGWWLFMRLEAMEGAATGVHLPSWAGMSRKVEPKHPLWQLVKKELYLQHMTFAITVVYVVVCAAVVVLDVAPLDRYTSVVGAMTAVYALGIPVLAGSLATAQERQFGTLAWQLQLPTPAWQQFAVKLAIVFGLALLLSTSARVLLLNSLWPSERHPLEIPIVLAIVMAATSMYLSSLCTTAVRAVVASFVGVAFVLWLLLRWLVTISALSIERTGGVFAVLSATAALLAGLAFVNHRPEPPGATRIVQQVVAVAALMALGFGVLTITRF